MRDAANKLAKSPTGQNGLLQWVLGKLTKSLPRAKPKKNFGIWGIMTRDLHQCHYFSFLSILSTYMTFGLPSSPEIQRVNFAEFNDVSVGHGDIVKRVWFFQVTYFARE